MNLQYNTILYSDPGNPNSLFSLQMQSLLYSSYFMVSDSFFAQLLHLRMYVIILPITGRPRDF